MAAMALRIPIPILRLFCGHMSADRSTTFWTKTPATKNMAGTATIRRGPFGGIVRRNTAENDAKPEPGNQGQFVIAPYLGDYQAQT